ncbi:MAG: 3-methyl-2-oxobutanoate hydroxymethyltransferase [Chitinivibrionales bacterium]|nr:3-methyl-2-oxobutanoate hydroxymethyltransferase [Chitinivibrionales bacterium]
MKISVSDIQKKKTNNEPIVMLTSYDYPTAVLEDACGIDIQLVGDSLGTNILGYTDVSEVTVDDMRHHLRAVARGAAHSFVLCDMPYHSFQSSGQALITAQQFIHDGADGIKIEGEKGGTEIIKYLVEQGSIPVCGHIGYKPQFDGHARIQGKDAPRAIELCESALAIQRAGAFMIVLELIPELLAREITNLLRIPTIGIGAGRYCSGQVQVVNDISGMSSRTFRHSKEYAGLRTVLNDAVTLYADEVRQKAFPTEKNVSRLPEEAFAEVSAWLVNRRTSNGI